MKKILFTLAAICIVTGCAQNSGIVPYGANNYMVSRQAATGFTGMGTLKSEALQEASAYCAKTNKTVEIVQQIDAEPPYILGNYPRAEIHFRCI